MKPIVFLDIDGVLHLPYDKVSTLNAAPVKALNWLTEAADAQIVVSSVWRLMHGYKDVLVSQGVEAKIIGRTPDLAYRGKGKVIWSSVTRGSEIKAWLYRRSSRPFVIIDDDADMDDLSDRLIQTDHMTGLTMPLAELALKTLSRQR